MFDAVPLTTWLAYLDWEYSHPDAMSAMELDGYLTGLAVTPSFTPTVPWRWEVWGTKGPVPFNDPAHKDEVLAGLRQYYVDNAAAIAIGPKAYSPLCQPISGDPDLGELRAWCTGFMLGMESDPAYWHRMLADKRGEFAAAPIMAFFPDGEGRYHEPTAAQLPDLLLAGKAIGAAVCALWSLGGQKRVGMAKVGRNDRCPCNSGKKYKQCCGR